MLLRWIIVEPRLVGGSLLLRTANCAALYTRPASFGTFFRAAFLGASSSHFWGKPVVSERSERYDALA